MDNKKFMIMCIAFCVLDIVFFLLGHFKVIETFTTYVCVTYVTYFAGIAAFYNAKHLKEQSKIVPSRLSMALSIFMITASIAFLIYGVVLGEIPLIPGKY